MTRRKPARQWMRRHVRDPYVKEAVRSGYRSRAALKLIEIDRRDRLLRPGMTVVDLGASPGGWTQVATAGVGRGGRVIAVDILPMQPVPGAVLILADCREDDTRAAVAAAIGGAAADLVLSDMAPNLTGVASTDEARSQELVVLAASFARELLKPRGTLLVKIFHGSGLEAVIDELKAVFVEVSVRKPAASRSESKEAYVLCRGLTAASSLSPR